MSENQPNPRRRPEIATPPARTGDHELVEITAWLPGHEPTGCSIDLREGDGYPSTYWRCRACGAERDRKKEFGERCPGPGKPTPRLDGGYSVDDARTRRALREAMVVEFVRLGPLYRVQSQSGNVYLVDVDAETCTCPDHSRRGGYCKHLRRVDLEIRVGTVPGPDGTFLG